MIQRTATLVPPSSQGIEQMCCGMKAASGSEPISPIVWCMTEATP